MKFELVTMSKVKEWDKALISPDIGRGYSNPVIIDNENFVVSTPIYPYQDAEANKTKGLYTYNTTSKSWTDFIKYSANVDTLDSHEICYDAKNKRILMYGYQKRLFIYNYDKNIFKRYDQTIQIGSYPNLICIDGDFHLIGGATNKYHKIWDTEKNEFKNIYEFEEWNKGNYGGVLLYFDSKQELLLFGGYDYSISKCFDTVRCHKIGDKEWKNSDLTLPRAMKNFGCILTSNQRFLIIFGGSSKDESQGSMELDDIWILDFQALDDKWKKSDIKCPKKGAYYAVLMGSQDNNELLVHGYIRTQMKKLELFLPDEILNLISLWYADEVVHLIHRHVPAHWTMNINDILL